MRARIGDGLVCGSGWVSGAGAARGCWVPLFPICFSLRPIALAASAAGASCSGSKPRHSYYREASVIWLLIGMETTSEMEETFESLSILKSSIQLPSDCSMALIQPEGNSSPLVKQLRRLLFRRMLVGVSDGRFFVGSFHCIDKQGNIILQDAVEYRSTRRNCPSPMEQRCLGLILIPASCRTSCHVDCSVEEQMSLLSLQN